MATLLFVIGIGVRLRRLTAGARVVVRRFRGRGVAEIVGIALILVLAVLVGLAVAEVNP